MASLENFRLIVFRAVAEEKSFRKAAEDLYLTQPAVSLQIKALEEEMGVQLFHRGGAQIELTAAGEVLLRCARQSGALLREAEAEIAALSGGFSGRLALGASTTIAQYVLPRLLGEFLRAHPRVSATLVSGNTEEIVDAVAAQKIALGLIEGPARNREVKTVPFLLDELVLIVPDGSEWGEGGEIGLAELARMPLLLRERGSGTRRIVELALERGGLKRGALQIAMELDSTEAIKSAVEAGLGAGFVSHCALAKDARLGAGFRVVEMEWLCMQRQLLIASLKGPEEQRLAQEFRRFLLARCVQETNASTHAAARRPGR